MCVYCKNLFKTFFVKQNFQKSCYKRGLAEKSSRKFDGYTVDVEEIVGEMSPGARNTWHTIVLECCPADRAGTRLPSRCFPRKCGYDSLPASSTIITFLYFQVFLYLRKNVLETSGIVSSNRYKPNFEWFLFEFTIWLIVDDLHQIASLERTVLCLQIKYLHCVQTCRQNRKRGIVITNSILKLG